MYKIFAKKNYLVWHPKKDFCEWCSFLWLYQKGSGDCIICRDKIKNEDTICKEKFSHFDFKYEKYIGYYLETIDAISPKYQQRSSSGGFMTLLLETLLLTKEVDYVVAVTYSKNENRFRYTKISTLSELIQSQRSAYYPISLEDALDIIAKNNGTCAITCIPSAAKALELLKSKDSNLNNKIKYTIGLACHSTKLREYTDYLCRKAGKEDGMEWCDYISYRDKEKIGNGGFGTFVAKKGDVEWNLRGKWPDWSIGLLQYFSSDFVDDHYSECADICTMDGWHKNYIHKNGTSLVIVRNHRLLDIIKNMNLEYNRIPPRIILDSQRSNIGFKNAELAIRLQFYKTCFKYAPHKRVHPSWGKNPVKIVKVISRLYMSAYIEKIYKQHDYMKKIRRCGVIFNFIYRNLNKLDKLLDR